MQISYRSKNCLYKDHRNETYRQTVNMKSIVALVVLCSLLANASETYFDRQKAVLNLFQHVYQKDVHIENYAEVQNFKFDATKFNDANVYNRFMHKRYENGVNEVFTLSNYKHREEAIALYDLFVAANDLTTLYKVALWARYNVNPDLFVYSITVALLHRPDMQDVELPALYEIQPDYFFNSEVIERAQEVKMQGFTGFDKVDGVYSVAIPANYTGQNFIANSESRLSYYTEDIGLNANYYYLHAYYPVWKMSGEILENRAIVLLKYFKYALARYYMERLSNGLGSIPQFSWHEPIAAGYYPQLQYHCGATYPVRNNYYKLYNPDNYYEINDIVDFETVFRHQLIDASAEKVFHLLGKYVMTAKKVLGGISNEYAPSVFHHFQTSMRDPLYYQLFNRAYKMFPRNEVPYKVDEIKYDGVKIETVEMDKLVTYFDKFDADISSSVNVKTMYDSSVATSDLFKFGRVSQYDGQDFVFKARQNRLNHLPFEYKLSVVSDKAQKVLVKVFMGPKYDEYGHMFDINENRENFYELDYYHADLVEGKNVLTRNCHEFAQFSPDRKSYFELFKNLMLTKDVAKNEVNHKSEHYLYNYPWRMLLPRGKKDGMPVQFFFMIVPQTVEQATPKTKYFLYPLDRPIDETHWHYDNMHYYDTMVFHKVEKEIK